MFIRAQTEYFLGTTAVSKLPNQMKLIRTRGAFMNDPASVQRPHRPVILTRPLSAG